MSIDTHSPSGTGFHCEAVTAGTIASPCLHSRMAPSFNPTGSDRGASHTDDPAVLIGLAFAFVRQGTLLDGPVPEPVTLRLSALADGGNAACRLLLDWLRNRNRDLGSFLNEDMKRTAPVAASADTHRPHRSPRERVLAASVRSDHRERRKRIRTRPHDPVRNPETAIIAAETGGRADG